MMLVWESRVIRLHRTSLVTDNERGCCLPREERVRRPARWGRGGVKRWRLTRRGIG